MEKVGAASRWAWLGGAYSGTATPVDSEDVQWLARWDDDGDDVPRRRQDRDDSDRWDDDDDWDEDDWDEDDEDEDDEDEDDDEGDGDGDDEDDYGDY